MKPVDMDSVDGKVTDSVHVISFVPSCMRLSCP